MKKVLLSAIVSLSSFALYAQPTLNAANLSPRAGDIFYGHTFDTTGITAGAAGAAITWDFDTLTQISIDTSAYVTCASTPYCDSFPGANIAINNGDSYAYGITSASKVQLIGAYAMGTKVQFTGGLDVMYYPLNYHSTHVDTHHQEVSGFPLFNTTIDSFHADAYGTLKLPSGTYTNVLRVHQVTISRDSINFGVPSVETNRSETYNWYAAGFRSPLLTLTYDTAAGVSYLSDARYYTKNSPVSVLNTSAAQLQVYPNPASGSIHIAFGSSDKPTAIVITDIMGREAGRIAAEQIGNRTDVTYDVSGLANGMYIIHMQTANGSASRKFTVAK
ncbi:MAG: T9SS type A sorting domain-containing protein [Bacteroidota bacterium]